MLSPPSHQEVEATFLALLSGQCSRDQADRWAAQWVCASDPTDMPPATWDALTKLFGSNMPDIDGSHIHSMEQIGEWLEVFLNESLEQAP